MLLFMHKIYYSRLG